LQLLGWEAKLVCDLWLGVYILGYDLHLLQVLPG